MEAMRPPGTSSFLKARGSVEAPVTLKEKLANVVIEACDGDIRAAYDRLDIHGTGKVSLSDLQSSLLCLHVDLARATGESSLLRVVRPLYEDFTQGFDLGDFFGVKRPWGSPARGRRTRPVVLGLGHDLAENARSIEQASASVVRLLQARHRLLGEVRGGHAIDDDPPQLGSGLLGGRHESREISDNLSPSPLRFVSAPSGQLSSSARPTSASRLSSPIRPTWGFAPASFPASPEDNNTRKWRDASLQEKAAAASWSSPRSRARSSSRDRSWSRERVSSGFGESVAQALLAASADGDATRVRIFRRRPDWIELIRCSRDAKTQRTALHLAARHGRNVVIGILILGGAIIDAVERRGVTPISLACMHGHLGAAKLLLEAAADPAKVDMVGRSALHFASCCGNPAVARLVVEWLPELLHCCDRHGRSPAHYALTNPSDPERCQILALLLELRSDGSRSDNFGCTPLMCARQRNDSVSSSLLLRHGALALAARGPVIGEPSGHKAFESTLRSGLDFTDTRLKEALPDLAALPSMNTSSGRSGGVGSQPQVGKTLAAPAAPRAVNATSLLQGAVVAIQKDQAALAAEHKDSRNSFSCVVVAAQLVELLRRHPHLDSKQTAVAHPLHYWVQRCQSFIIGGAVSDAQMCLMRLTTSLDVEMRKLQAAFRRFDIDGSGQIDAAEFQTMCAYVGWGVEVASEIDTNADNCVTLAELQQFVDKMGGVQRLFENRRKRIALRRSDVCSLCNVVVGSRVRAHFYVKGRKSRMWREGTVLAVGIKQEGAGAGPAGQLVKVAFGFGQAAEHCQWMATQAIPPNWIVSTMDDAALADALRQVGILDEDQGYWGLLLPPSEMRSVTILTGCQRAALASVRAAAAESHEKMLPIVRERFHQLGHSETEFQQVLAWIQDLAPVIVQVRIDSWLETDDYYRSQFETNTSCGAIDEGNCTRINWEQDLFGGHYDNCKPIERCKYGLLDVSNDYRGCSSALQYGDSYLVLKDVRLRLTFASEDSGGMHGSRLGVLDKYAHVLAEYDDHEIRALVEVACAPELRPETESAQLIRGSTVDPVIEWITMGFPRFHCDSGHLYFEVELFEGCSSPQVGLLSTNFEATPYARSTIGVGDDENGWAVDGQHSARFHGGRTRGWGVSWSAENGVLVENVVIGVAVDFSARQIWFSKGDCWDEVPAFDSSDFPINVSLYPAVSLMGRAAFHFGPHFHYRPRDGADRWCGAPVGTVRLDCPRLGNSSQGVLCYKEIQIHGELNFRYHVQRLVAATRYRDQPKTDRSWGVRVIGSQSWDGPFERVCGVGNKPRYRNEKGAEIFWKPDISAWCIGMGGESEEHGFLFCAPSSDFACDEPPRLGWQVPRRLRGRVPVEVFCRAMVACSVSQGDLENLLVALSENEEVDQAVVYRHAGETTFDLLWGKLSNTIGTADWAWKRVADEMRDWVPKMAGFPRAVVVETPHPFDRFYHFNRKVQVLGAQALRVHFGSRCCTYDSDSKVMVSSVGICAETVGYGARVELRSPDGEPLQGTVESVFSVGIPTWLVRIDRDRLRALPEFKLVVDENPCAICSCNVTKVSVTYEGGHLGKEISGFVLVPSFPLTPFRIKGFLGYGPAQQVGVQGDWFLDLEATLLEAEGLGGLSYSFAEALRNLHEVEKRLNALCQETLEVESVTLHFYNALECRILPVVHARYECDFIGEEIKSFSLTNLGLKVESFAKVGPAYTAGARPGWYVDWQNTLMTNAMLAREGNLSDVPIDNPLAILKLHNIVLALVPPDTESQNVCGEFWGPSCQWKDVIEVPGDVAEFEFVSDGDGNPEQRWGFFALVMPQDSEEATRETLDAFEKSWHSAIAAAEGCDAGALSVERDSWDEERLRALCLRHGWEFEWMTEDGERRRRMCEFQGTFQSSDEALATRMPSGRAPSKEGGCPASVEELPDSAVVMKHAAR